MGQSNLAIGQPDLYANLPDRKPNIFVEILDIGQVKISFGPAVLTSYMPDRLVVQKVYVEL
jgi:hypothetical protein